MLVSLFVLSLVAPALSFIFTTLFFLRFRNSKVASILYGLAFASIFYNYIPDIGNDSVRHMEMLNIYSTVSLTECFDAGSYRNLFVWDIWNWIIAQFKTPYLLPASGAFLGYSLIFYMALDYLILINANRSCVIKCVALLLLITNPLSYAVGIRNGCAFALVALGFYLYEIKKCSKLLTCCIFLSSVFIHRASVVPFLMWVILPLYKRKPKLVLVVVVGSLLSLSVVINIVMSNIGSAGLLSQIILEMFSSVESYQQMNSYNIENSTSLYARVNSFFNLSLLAVCLYRSRVVLRLVEKAFKYSDREICISTGSFLSLAFLFAVISGCMMVVLIINGGRYLGLTMLLIQIPLFFSFHMMSFDVFYSPNHTFFWIDKLICICAASVFALNCYALGWGTGSLNSVIIGVLGGLIIPIVTNL